MARAVPPGLRRHRRRDHPRPLLPRQRRPRGSSSSTAARDSPFEGNYSGWLEQKQQRLAQEEKQNQARRRTLERELEWVRMAPKARQSKSQGAARRRTSSSSPRRRRPRDASAQLEIGIPAGPRLGEQVIEAQDLAKAFGDTPADRGPDVLTPPRRDRRRHRPQRRGQDHAVPNDRGIGRRRWRRPRLCARRRHRSWWARRWTWPTWTSPATPSMATNTVYEEITDGLDVLKVGNREINGRAYVRRVQLQGSRPAEERRRSLRR